MSLRGPSQLATGFILSNLFGLGVFKGFQIIANWTTAPGMVLLTSMFVAVPFGMGLITAWFWKSLNLRSLALYSLLFLNAFIALAWAFLVVREGYICLIIISPLLIPLLISGYQFGAFIFGRNDNRLNCAVFALLVGAVWYDSLLSHDFERSVSDEIRINAPPSVVWQHVVAFDEIAEAPRFWLFRIGMPMPLKTTVAARKAGADRKCIFTQNAVFEETMSVYDPEKELTFEIVTPPRDPEVIGHIEFERGQFLLHGNPDGSTTLLGTSWYRLRVFPAWYFDLWAESITRNVHLRVMRHIQKLSEASATNWRQF